MTSHVLLIATVYRQGRWLGEDFTGNGKRDVSLVTQPDNFGTRYRFTSLEYPVLSAPQVMIDSPASLSPLSNITTTTASQRTLPPTTNASPRSATKSLATSYSDDSHVSPSPTNSGIGILAIIITYSFLVFFAFKGHPTPISHPSHRPASSPHSVRKNEDASTTPRFSGILSLLSYLKWIVVFHSLYSLINNRQSHNGSSYVYGDVELTLARFIIRGGDHIVTFIHHIRLVPTPTAWFPPPPGHLQDHIDVFMILYHVLIACVASWYRLDSGLNNTTYSIGLGANAGSTQPPMPQIPLSPMQRGTLNASNLLRGTKGRLVLEQIRFLYPRRSSALACYAIAVILALQVLRAATSKYTTLQSNAGSHWTILHFGVDPSMIIKEVYDFFPQDTVFKSVELKQSQHVPGSPVSTTETVDSVDDAAKGLEYVRRPLQPSHTLPSMFPTSSKEAEQARILKQRRYTLDDLHPSAYDIRARLCYDSDDEILTADTPRDENLFFDGDLPRVSSPALGQSEADDEDFDEEVFRYEGISTPGYKQLLFSFTDPNIPSIYLEPADSNDTSKSVWQESNFTQSSSSGQNLYAHNLLSPVDMLSPAAASSYQETDDLDTMTAYYGGIHDSIHAPSSSALNSIAEEEMEEEPVLHFNNWLPDLTGIPESMRAPIQINSAIPEPLVDEFDYSTLFQNGDRYEAYFNPASIPSTEIDFDALLSGLGGGELQDSIHAPRPSINPNHEPCSIAAVEVGASHAEDPLTSIRAPHTTARAVSPSIGVTGDQETGSSVIDALFAGCNTPIDESVHTLQSTESATDSEDVIDSLFANLGSVRDSIHATAPPSSIVDKGEDRASDVRSNGVSGASIHTTRLPSSSDVSPPNAPSLENLAEDEQSGLSESIHASLERKGKKGNGKPTKSNRGRYRRGGRRR